MFVLVSNELITKLGMYVLLPIFIAFLFLSCLIFQRKTMQASKAHFGFFGTGRRFFWLSHQNGLGVVF